MEPPVPIPNTEVKRFSADNTEGGTPREDMPLPGGFKYKVMVKEKFDGQTLKGVLELAEVKLKQHEKELNRLNVFPVPDGDTGTNMYLTLQAAKNAVTKLPTNSAATTSADRKSVV